MSFTQEKKINCNEYSINQKAKGVIVVNDAYGASWACAGCKMHCVTGATQSAVQQMFVPSIAGVAIERYVGERGVVQPAPCFGTSAAAVEFAKRLTLLCDNYRQRVR